MIILEDEYVIIENNQERTKHTGIMTTNVKLTPPSLAMRAKGHIDVNQMNKYHYENEISSVSLTTGESSITATSANSVRP